MKKPLYTYETTYEREDSEGNVICSLEVQFKYTFTPGVPARINWNENDHPAEDPEIEIADIMIETWQYGLGKNAVYAWTKVYDRDLYDQLYDWGETSWRDNMVENAIEDDECRREAAMELAAEVRRELQEMDCTE